MLDPVFLQTSHSFWWLPTPPISRDTHTNSKTSCARILTILYWPWFFMSQADCQVSCDKSSPPPNWAESSSGPMLKNPNLANTSWYAVVSYATKTGIQRGVCHTVALPFTLKRLMLRWKKYYGNSNFSAWKNIIFKKSSKLNQNPSRYYNCITNLKFQHKPKKYDLSRILIQK
jgi:hypothetical protein